MTLPLTLTLTLTLPLPLTLTLTQEFAKAHMPALSWQFAVTRNAVFLVWHLFPIVWALAAADAISVEVEHMGCAARMCARRACVRRAS